MALFGVKKGLKIFGDSITSSVLNGTADPSVVGVAAEIGSVYFREDGVTWKKTGVADTDWQPYSEIEGGGLLWESKNASFVAEAGKGYVLDSAGGAITISLPAAPELGDRIAFAGLGALETNNATVDFGPAPFRFQDTNDDLVIDLNYCYFELLYTGDAAVGWVLSNTDESKNITDIINFIGSGNNTNPGVPEYSSTNVVVQGDNLETAIGKLDGESANVNAFIGKDGAGAILPDYTSRASDVGLPYVPEKIADSDDLELAVAKLDKAIQTVEDVVATGMSWISPVVAAVSLTEAQLLAETFNNAGFGYFTFDTLQHREIAQADRVVIVGTGADRGKIYEFDGSSWQYIQTLSKNQAVSVAYDLVTPGDYEVNGAAYMMNSDESDVYKVADFDMENANSIGMSSAYAQESGVVTSAQTIEGAIHALDAQVKDINDFIGKGIVAGEKPNFTARTAEVDPSYVPTVVTDNDDLELSVAKLDYTVSNIVSSNDQENVTVIIPDGGAVSVQEYPAADFVGAKIELVIFHSTGRIAEEVFILNNDTDVDFTEYSILAVGNPMGVSVYVTMASGNVQLSVTNNAGENVTVIAKRSVIRKNY